MLLIKILKSKVGLKMENMITRSPKITSENFDENFLVELGEMKKE